MRVMRYVTLACAALVLGSSWTATAGDTVAKPNFDRIHRERPSEYLALLPTMGTKSRIEKVAAEIGGASFEAKLAGVSRWIGSHLKYDEHAAYAWRDFDKMVADGTFGGCADHALIYGCLTRALGIPTVWVKTMDADWIREFRSLGESGMRGWRGHVFLEVHDGKRWLLLNATDGILHEDYDVQSRILPGTRFAYDKGGDPYALNMSTRWEEWKQQTRAYFKDFDLAQLPVAQGRPLEDDSSPIAYLAADEPGWDLLYARFLKSGWRIGRSGNVGFEDWIPRSRGRTLVVASVAGHEVLPESLRKTFTPKPFAELAKEEGRGDSWVMRRVLDDGTRVILLYAKDEASLASAISTLKPDEK